MASKGKSGEVSKFKWTNEMVQDLLDSLSEFKSIMEFNNFDFNADKPRQYEEVRRIMSQKYLANLHFFGPKNCSNFLIRMFRLWAV